MADGRYAANMSERVRLHGMAYGGAAVGRLEDGLAVFVNGALPGELAEIDVGERKKNFARGTLIEVAEPVSERIQPPCPHFLQGCGGCDWQYAGYDAQLAYKQAILADQLRRMGGIADAPMLEPVASPLPYGYRNSAEFHVAAGRIGFHREGTHELINTLSCPLMEEPINTALTVLRNNRETLAGVRSVAIRNGSDALQLTFLMEDDPRGFRLIAAELAAKLEPVVGKPVGIAGVRAGSDRMRGLAGEPWLRMELGGRAFRVSALSFFQVNAGVAEQLAAIVAAQVRPGDRVLDLFAGVGTFGLLAADTARDVVGIESHPAAVADASTNIAEAGAENVRITQGDVGASAELAAGGWDVAILDPPRGGCPRKVLEGVEAKRVVYVSCDPSTLARDLKVLLERGFRPESVQLLDMFPQTYHIEAVALLIR
jgi:23S rRNA (uracil1939-C5)-methyltransferase